MCPALTIAPVMALLLMVMPVFDGATVVIVPVPVLVTLPETVEFWMKMQLMAPELLTGPTETPTSAMAQAANAAGVPPPINSAATEVDSRRPRLRPRPDLPKDLVPRRENTRFARNTTLAAADVTNKGTRL